MGRTFWFAAIVASLFVLAAVIVACGRLPVTAMRTVPTVSDGSKTYYGNQPYQRAPTETEFAFRLAWSVPLAILLTLCAVRFLFFSFRWLPIELLSNLKPRYTIRDMLLLALLVALTVGWLTDHRREEEVIKLQEAREQRQDKLISESQAHWEILSSVLKSNGQRLKDLVSAMEILRSEIRSHYPTNEKTADPIEKQN